MNDGRPDHKTAFWKQAGGPLLTIVAVAALELSSWLGFTVPNPAVVYLTAVVYAAFQGGIVPGLVSGGITLFYAAWFFSAPGQLFHYSSENAARVIVLAVATPAMVLMTGALRLRHERMLRQEQKLVADLQKALSEIKTLRGIVPICAACKKVRDDKGYWNQVEVYVETHSDAQFSHGICPECAQRLYPELFADKTAAAEVK